MTATQCFYHLLHHTKKKKLRKNNYIPLKKTKLKLLQPAWDIWNNGSPLQLLKLSKLKKKQKILSNFDGSSALFWGDYSLSRLFKIYRRPPVFEKCKQTAEKLFFMWMGRKTTLLGALFPDYCEILLLIKLKKKFTEKTSYTISFFFWFFGLLRPFKKKNEI